MWVNSFPKLFCELVGAFIIWTIKGFKGKFSDEMAGPFELGNKSTRNLLITAALIFVVILIGREYEKKPQLNDKKTQIMIKK